MNASNKMLKRGGGTNVSKKLLAAVAVLAVAMSVFACVTVSQDADAADITYISGGIQDDFTVTKGMVVVVNGDLKIDKGLTFTVQSGATLTINEGVKVTVDGQNAEKENAEFIVEKGSRVLINGQLAVGENGSVSIVSDFVVPGEKVDKDTVYTGTFVYGSVTAQKGGVLGIVAQVMNGGSVSISSTGEKVSSIVGTLLLMPGANADLKGNVGVVSNETQTVDEGADSEEDFDWMDKGYGMYVAAYGIDLSKEAGKQVGTISLMAVSGQPTRKAADAPSLTFAASADSSTVYCKADGSETATKTTAVVATLDVQGKVASAELAAVLALGINDGDVTYYSDKDCKNKSDLVSSNTVSGEFQVTKTGKLAMYDNLTVTGKVSVLDADENLVISAGDLKVTGTFEAVSDSFATFDEEGKGTFTEGQATLEVVGGTFTVTNKDVAMTSVLDVFASFEGAFYLYESTTESRIVVCDFGVAIAAADGQSVQQVHVSGGVPVASGETATPAEIRKAALTVSQDFTVPAGVTLTVYKGVVIDKAAVATVAQEGVLAFESGAYLFVDGKLIDLTKTDDWKECIVSDVIIEDDEAVVNTYTSLTIAIKDIGSGKVTLKDDATVSEDMTVPADITVDLNGMKMTVAKGKTLTVEGIIDASTGTLKTEDKTAKIVVNDYIIVGNVAEFAEAEFNVAGIYATATIDGIDGTCFVMSVPFYALHVSDVTGEAEVQGPLSYAKDVTFAGTADETLTLAIDEDSSFTVTGKITLSYFAIDADGPLTAAVANSVGQVSLTSVSGIVVSDVVSEDDGASLQISGTASGDKPAVSIASGKLTIAEEFVATGLKSFDVASGTVLVVSAETYVQTMKVAGTLNVTAGTLFVSKDLTVSGAVAVSKDAKVTVTRNAYIGMSAGDLTGATASVSGEGTFTANLLYIAPGSTVAEAVLKDLKSTKFTSEDKELFTVYGKSDAAIAIGDVKPAVTNAKFVCWTDAKTGETLKDTITVGSPAQAVAKIDKEIYTVTVIGDNGIGTVAIDGNVLAKSSNTFQIENLVAGQHTIKVDLKYGFEGNPVIKVNGTTVSNGTFTLSGTSADDTNVKIDISGTVPASTDPAVPEKKDDGMQLTDYLLIVLVVLIVILAVIVAMRLMRS